ncbi:MAG TPA: TetR/AcrR family transcriptional regulator [Capillimicrobium sp.]|nr:TetR/AcrR family transcriptional regulator [Capillimicrobium sp.]
MAAAPPTRPALRARYDKRQLEVIEVAARVFAERGYHATSVSDLTEATGLTAGGLYHYIGSKEELLARICDALMQPLLDRAREIVATDAGPEEQLRTLLRTWVEHITIYRHHMLVFAQERHVIEHEPHWRAVRRQRKEFQELLDGLLERLEAAGEVRFGDRGVALMALLGMVNYTPQWLRPRGRLGADELADGYLDLLLGRQAA